MDINDDTLAAGRSPALAAHTGYLLRRAFLAAVQQHGGPVMPEGRHPRELGILVTLKVTEPMSQRRLGELLGVNRSVMVKLADVLETDGLITRERDPADRRNYALRLTATGRTMLAKMSRSAAKAEAQFTAALTEAERERLVELLSDLLADMVANLPADLTRRTGFLLARAYHRMRVATERALHHVGIAPQQFGVLATLAAIEPSSQQRLAATLGVSGPAIVAPLTALENAGLVTRERNPSDRREHLFELTMQGRARLDQASAALAGVDDRLAAQIGRRQVKELNSLLTKLAP